jgi:hypothetical protein
LLPETLGKSSYLNLENSPGAFYRIERIDGDACLPSN